MPAHMPGEERKVDQRQNILDTVVMFCYSERPAQLRAFGCGIVECKGGYGIRWNAGNFRCSVESPLLNTGFEALKPNRCIIDEIFVCEISVYDLASEAIRERDIRSNINSKPSVGPLCSRRAPGIDNIELCSGVDGFENVMKEDRMRFERIGSPEDNNIGLFGLMVRARTTTRSKYGRQTDDAGSMSSAIAAIDVVGTHHLPREFLRRVVHLIGGF